MPFISQAKLEWLFKHSFYPTFTRDKKGRKRFHFGALPPRKTIAQAISDAIKCEKEKAQ